MRRWVDWETALEAKAPSRPRTYESFVELLKETYAEYTPEFAAAEAGVKPGQIVAIAEGIAAAGHAFSSHTWRSIGSGNLGGWQYAIYVD